MHQNFSNTKPKPTGLADIGLGWLLVTVLGGGFVTLTAWLTWLGLRLLVFIFGPIQ